MSDQYDISPEQKLILEEKAKRRAVLRQEFLKLKSDPFVHATGEAGSVFDPAIQRYTALKANGYDYFRPNVNNGKIFFGLFVLPVIACCYFIGKSRTNTERAYRNGEVAYKDRLFKFV